MIRNIIFDMGNVLIRFAPAYFIDRYGITDETDKALLLSEVFRSGEWTCLDDGSKTEEEALTTILPRLPERLRTAAADLMTGWDRPLILIDGMYELIEKLHANGYKLYLLSNASSRQHEYWPRIPESRFFTDTLISADVKLVKPGREIYELALKRFCIRADESIFIDDHGPNIDAASDVGIDAVIFSGNAAGLAAELRGHGVNI